MDFLCMYTSLQPGLCYSISPAPRNSREPGYLLTLYAFFRSLFTFQHAFLHQIPSNSVVHLLPTLPRRFRSNMLQSRPDRTGKTLLRVQHNKRRAQRLLRSGRSMLSQWLLLWKLWIPLSWRMYGRHMAIAVLLSWM